MNWYLTELKKCTDFDGRACRKEFWMYFLMSMAIWFVLTGVWVASIHNLVLLRAVSSIQRLYDLAILIPAIALGIRRMHDTNHSGWWSVVPVVNLIFAAQDGEGRYNQYGPDPKGRGEQTNPYVRPAETFKPAVTFTPAVSRVQASPGSDCPYHYGGDCVPHGRNTGRCSLTQGSYLTSCFVYPIEKARG